MDYSAIFTYMYTEIALVAVIVAALLYDLMAGKRGRKAFHGVMCTLMVLFIAGTVVPYHRETASIFGGMYVYTPVYGIVKSILAAGTLLVFLQADSWLKKEDTEFKRGEFYVLTLSTLLGMTPQHIDRGRLDEQQMPEEIKAGVPLQLLSNRPDVRAAEMSLASAFYLTNKARSAFYPKITVTGTLGWSNGSTGTLNPAEILKNAVASLTQPIFNRGALIANLKITKAQQEQAKLAFQQTVLDAGAEVSNALYAYQTVGEKSVERDKQVKALEDAVDATIGLMNVGQTTYLDVITAQQSLLSAQLTQVQDDYDYLQSVISLYQALGGGRSAE